MILWFVRVIFLLTVLASTWLFYISPKAVGDMGTVNQVTFILVAPLAIASVLVIIDIFWRRKNLLALSGVFFGLLAGLVLAQVIELVFTFIMGMVGIDIKREPPPATVEQRTVIQRTIAPETAGTPTPQPVPAAADESASPDGAIPGEPAVAESDNVEAISAPAELSDDVEPDQLRPFVQRFIAPRAVANDPAVEIATLMLMLLKTGCVYLCVSFVMQTRDDFRFIIPYVEFSRQVKGVHPVLLDTSILIDGRIAEMVATHILDCPLIVPRFVLGELHALSDSADSLKRARGRRGLDVLKKLKGNREVDLTIMALRNERIERAVGVDNKLVELALELSGRVMTTDFNLNKVADLRGVTVINLNELANCMKAAVLPGERMRVKLLRPGEASGQGVGFLDDGTMVVVDGGRPHIGQTVGIEITSMIQTSAGKMVFGRISEGGDEEPEPHGQRRDTRQARGKGHDDDSDDDLKA